MCLCSQVLHKESHDVINELNTLMTYSEKVVGGRFREGGRPRQAPLIIMIIFKTNA